MTTAQIGWPLSNELLLVVCLSQKRGGRQEASVALSTSKLTRALAAPWRRSSAELTKFTRLLDLRIQWPQQRDRQRQLHGR